MGEVAQFSRIEERTPAVSAGLESNVGLARVNHVLHAAVAARAIVASLHIVALADGRVPGVQGSGRLLAAQGLDFTSVKPQALAVSAAVDLNPVPGE